MSITQRNTYVIGSNNDLSNALLNIDLNRIGGDLTYLENDAGTLKVSVGSLIEADGSIYAVTGTTSFTPTGTAQDGAYLFFDPSIPSFVWSNTAGTYDPARGGIYDGSDRRQCRFRLKSATTWDVLLVPESPDVAIDGDLEVATINPPSGTLSVVDVIECSRQAVRIDATTSDAATLTASLISNNIPANTIMACSGGLLNNSTDIEYVVSGIEHDGVNGITLYYSIRYNSSTDSDFTIGNGQQAFSGSSPVLSYRLIL